MRKPQRSAQTPSAPAGTLAARAAEALRQKRFKEAVDLFKQLLRQESRPEWQQSLADAYHGRAHALAAKKMFKEAAIVLENTVAADGTLRNPLFYLHCLLRDGQMEKAAQHAMRYPGRELPLEERATLEELTAALLVAVPRPVEAAPPGRSPAPAAGAIAAEQARWLDLAAAARAALAGWVSGAAAEAMEPLLNRISLRSAFRPVRLLLKSLLGAPADAERARRLLEAIPPGSPFLAFREAVEAAMLAEGAMNADGWQRLSPVQRKFVAECRGLPAASTHFLARTAEAAQSGPAALFGFLLKQTDLPRAEVRSACLNLLPQIPDRLAQFEKSFGPLAEQERYRIQALAAEARGDWRQVELAWRDLIDATAGQTDRRVNLVRGVIFRHLAQLAAEHPQIMGDGDPRFDNPAAGYLEKAVDADPDYVPAVLELIGLHRAEERPKDWHRLADEAVRRFPDNSAVLLQATESAMARKAFKKAAGFAHRLLGIDPINPGVRRQMIELQVAQARKQMRAGRADLAARELAAAAEWERADSPSALLRIAHALVDLRIGKNEAAEARLRAGVELAGGGVAGWFRAALEAELMKLTAQETRPLLKALTQAVESPPTQDAVMAVVAALGQRDAAENKKVVMALLLRIGAWLERATAIEWPAAEFQALGEALARFEAFDLLGDFARAALRREPGNPIGRFHQILARTRANVDWLTIGESDELVHMIKAAEARQDLRSAARIERFLSGVDGPQYRRRRRGRALPDADFDPEAVAALVSAMAGEMPRDAADSLRDMVREIGYDAAVEEMIEQLSDSPLGAGMPPSMLRPLCRALVTDAMENGPPARRSAARKRRF